MGVQEGQRGKMRMARVLFIDDDEPIRLVLKTFFVKEGFEVELACDGEKGLAIHRERPVDVVVTDLLMPNKEGFETIQELRRVSPDLHIIAMSGGGRNSPNTYLKFAKTFGADLTFAKPFSPKLLVEAVKEMLGGNMIS